MELTLWQRLRSRAYLFGIGVVRHITLGTRVAVIEDGRVLLVRQTYLPGWHFPGGGVEPGETAIVSAARELEEETGFRPGGPLALQGLFLNVNAVTNRDHIAFYVCHGAAKLADRQPDYEIAEVAWFPLTDVPADTTPPTRRRVEEILSGGPPSEMW